LQTYKCSLKEHSYLMSTNSLTTDASLASTRTPAVALKPKRFHPALVALHWLIVILIAGTFFLAKANEGGGERFEAGERNFPAPNSQGVNPQQEFDSDEAPQARPPAAFPAQQTGQGVLSAIGLHMIVGLIILGLLVIRLAVRWTTRHPDWATTGNKFFDWVGNLTHVGLYLLTFAMTITGILLADQRGMLSSFFGIGSAPTPGGRLIGGFRLGFLHETTWILLLLLIALHVGAALYHQFFIKDNILGRMWFGKSTA
jgi:cytochrome b561